MVRAGCSSLDLHKRQVRGTAVDRTPESDNVNAYAIFKSSSLF